MKRTSVNSRITFSLEPGDLATIITQEGSEGRPVAVEIHCHLGYSSQQPQEPQESLTVTYEYTLKKPVPGAFSIPDRTEGWEDHTYSGYSGMPDWAQALMDRHAPNWWRKPRQSP